MRDGGPAGLYGGKADLEPSGSTTETDRFGFILGNGISSGEGPSPVLVRHREVKWLNIISQWNDVSQRRSSKVKGQCQKGIPASLRAKCWPLLCGAMERMRHNQSLYQTLDETPALQNWVDVIERDTDRQFPFHEMFLSKDGHGQRGLFKVLKAYTQFRPDEGYCQAQGPVAAVLLMNMPSEEAFWCLVQISELYLPGYYSPLLEGVLFDAAMLPWILKRACPAAHRHLQRQGVEPLMFATDWLMCLYTRHLPFNTLLRVWDLFFCYGVRVLFQVAVVLVRRVLGRGDQREKCDGQMETLERLRGVKEYLQHDDADAFIQEVCSVSLSEKDLQRRTERELEKWGKEHPNSTFDPRGRCHGYLMAWERVKEMEEKKEKKEREKGNLSLPLLRSPSSLSPSLLRKKWKKRGSKLAEDSADDSAGEQRLFQKDKQERESRKSRIDSTCSIDGPQKAEMDRGMAEPGIVTPNPNPSKKGRHIRTPSDGSMTSVRSEHAPTHTQTEGQGTPPKRTSGITIPEEMPLESDENTPGGHQEKVQTHSCIEDGEELQQKGTPEEDGESDKDGEVRETQTEKDEKHWEIQTEKAKLDTEIQIVKDKEGEIITVEGNDEEELQIVKNKSEAEIQILDQQGEETQTVKVNDQEMQAVKCQQEEEMQAAKESLEKEIQTVKCEQEEETIAVVKEQQIQTEQTEKHQKSQSQMDQRDETVAEKVLMSTGQEEWKGQTEQEAEEAHKSQGQTTEVWQTEETQEVTHEEVTGKYDLHMHRQEQEVQACSNSRQEDEVQPDEEDVERTGKKGNEETDVSSLDEGMWSQDSTFLPSTPPQEECLNVRADLMPPEPQSSPDKDCSSAMENSQTDVGPPIEGNSHHSHSPLTESHSETLTMKPTVEDQEQPQEIEVMTEEREATEGHIGYRGQETQEQMEEMEEGTKSIPEEASVNTSATTAQEICSSFPSRPQSPTDPSESHKAVTANSGEPTVTVQLTALPHTQTTSTTQLAQTDARKPSHGIQIQPDNPLGSEQDRLSQSEDTPHEVETENHTDTVTGRVEIEDKPAEVVCETQEAEKTTCDPVRLSQNSSDKTYNEAEDGSVTERTEKLSAEEKDEHSETEDRTSKSLESDTQSKIESDSVASSSGTEGADVTSLPDRVTGGTKAGESQPPTSNQVRVRRYSNSRSCYPRVLSEDIFKDPKDKPLQDNATPAQPQSPTQTEEPCASPTPQPTHSADTPGVTQNPKHAYSPSKAHTLNPADMGRQTDSPKRMGLFQRLRGGARSGATPKMTIPKILIQDFSEEAEEEALSSKERRKRRRERERREKEEEKLRKKREKEMEREKGRERKKPQTRGKSFQLPSSTFSAKDNTHTRNDSQTLVTRRNSTPLSEKYF